MSLKVHVVPRWGGTADSDWYPWFRKITGGSVDLRIHSMPGWDEPKIVPSLNYLAREVPTLDSSTVLVGHSVGAQAILRYLDVYFKKYPDHELGGLLVIAGWFAVDQPWDAIRPWMENGGLDYERIRTRTRQRLVVLSENDPYTADSRANKELWESRMGALVWVQADRAHFNGRIEPVMEAALGWFLLELDDVGTP